MSNIDRWRSWRPPGEKSDRCVKQTPTQPTELGGATLEKGFVGCSGVTARPAQEFCLFSTPEPTEPRESFHRWMLDRCVYESRSFAKIDELCRDFRGWSLHRNEVPFTATEFVQLISEGGFFFANGLVSGVVIRGDGPIHGRTRKSRRKVTGSKPGPVPLGGTS
jgi:hypothetical protein